MKTHCRQWVCGHCDCLGISLIFRLTTFDVRITCLKSSKSANRVFYISLNKGYFGKAIFSRLFSARYHILKKKKKKKRYWANVDVVLIITLSYQATCLVSYNCSVTHVRWGEGTSSVLFQWRPAFSALWRRGNSVVSVHHINNFWNTWSNLTKWRLYEYIYWNNQANFTIISLITFEILAQTLQNLQGSGHNTIRWCLQNYMEDGLELTSELTSKWITLKILNQIYH